MTKSTKDNKEDKKNKIAHKVLKVFTPLALFFGVGTAKAANTETIDKKDFPIENTTKANYGAEGFHQKYTINSEKSTFHQELSSNNNQDSAYIKEIINLSNGYKIEQYQFDALSKPSNTQEHQFERTLLRPDGSSLDVTDILEPANNIIPVDKSNNSARARINRGKNQVYTQNCLDNMNNISAEDKSAMTEFIESQCTLQEDPVKVSVKSHTTSYTQYVNEAKQR